MPNDRKWLVDRAQRCRRLAERFAKIGKDARDPLPDRIADDLLEIAAILEGEAGKQRRLLKEANNKPC